MIPDLQPHMQQIAQLLGSSFLLILAATAGNGHPLIRRNWRMLNFAMLPFSVFGGFCHLLYPANSAGVLMLLFPLKGFMDSRLDVACLSRGLMVTRAWKLLL